MPIYEYACKKCSHALDVLQKLSDAPLVECPECGEPALRRLISAPRFRLKGEGWYETDFKKDNKRNLVTADSEAPSKDKSEGKTEKADKSEGKTGTAEKDKVKPAAKASEKPPAAPRKESKADSG